MTAASEPDEHTSPPLISAPPTWDDVRNVLEDAQYLLDNHAAAQGWIDECRRRLDASGVVGLAGWNWETVDRVGGKPRKVPHGVRDYRAAVRKASVLLRLGHEYAHLVHELAGRNGYQLRSLDGWLPPPPAPAVASAAAAVLDGIDDWRSGKGANRQALYRYLRTRDFIRVELDPSNIV